MVAPTEQKTKEQKQDNAGEKTVTQETVETHRRRIYEYGNKVKPAGKDGKRDKESAEYLRLIKNNEARLNELGVVRTPAGFTTEVLPQAVKTLKDSTQNIKALREQTFSPEAEARMALVKKYGERDWISNASKKEQESYLSIAKKALEDGEKTLKGPGFKDYVTTRDVLATEGSKGLPDYLSRPNSQAVRDAGKEITAFQGSVRSVRENIRAVQSELITTQLYGKHGFNS